MKGAIGNALIMNIVITFIIIFFALLIGGMAYSKAYKVKNYLISEIDIFEKRKRMNFDSSDVYNENLEMWNTEVNDFMRKIGYHLATRDKLCLQTEEEERDKLIWSKTGQYDYCIYKKSEIDEKAGNSIIRAKYYYEVKVFMKFDFPIIGDTLRLPVVGQTKPYTIYR